MSLLTATGIRKSFAGVHALRGVSFDLAPGEVHALVGENGAGKSTLIRIMTGATQADGGSLELSGQAIGLAQFTPAAARARGIAAIYQQPALFPDLTVAENIAAAAESRLVWRPINWKRRRAQAVAWLERIGAAIDPDRLVGTLSMPEQQLVEIAKAIGAKARVVLMDEPTASLSTREVDRLFDVIASLKAVGVGVLYISHRLEEVFAIADRITVLRDGETVGTGPRATFTPPELVRLMAGRDLSAVFPKRPVATGDVALDVRGLSSRSDGLRGVSLEVRRGEILGLAGLVGSGRTQLAETLVGLRQSDDGEIRVAGRLERVDSPADARRVRLAYVPEDRRRHGVIAEMSLAANTSMAVLPTISRAGLVQAERERDVADRYVQRFQIKAPSVDALVGTLSGGNQQKVSLARALATDPAVLILDEPTQGVDVGAKAEIHGLMQDLAERGTAILMISSELPEILGMSDRIAVMRGGSIAGVLSREDATPEAVLTLALGSVQPASEAAGPERDATWRDGASAALAPPTARAEARALHQFRNVSLEPRRRRVEVSLALTILALSAVLLVRAPAFFAPANLLDVLLAALPVLIVATGATLVMLTGEIDISVGSAFAVASVAAGAVANLGVPMPLVALLTVVVGSALGGLNGALVSASALAIDRRVARDDGRPA